MEQVILRKLDEMFSDVRQEIHLKHLQKVHPVKEQKHQSNCLSSHSHSNPSINRRQSSSLSNQVTSSRRVSMPAKLGTTARRGSMPSPSNGDGRRSSLPVYPAAQTTRRHSSSVMETVRETQRPTTTLQQRRDSTSSTGSTRKFSRDSLDLDLVIEDAAEADADSDYNNSVIVEEDEEIASDKVTPFISRVNGWCGFYFIFYRS